MKRLTTTLAIATMLASFTHAVNLGVANTFNAFIFNSATTDNGEAEGAIAVGGNWGGSNYTTSAHGSLGTVGSLTNIGAYVGGNINVSGGLHANGGSSYYVANSISVGTLDGTSGSVIYYGTTQSGNIHPTTVNTNLVDMSVFAQQKAYSIAQSSYLSSLSSTAIDTSDINSCVLNVVSGLNVFSINGSALGGNPRNITINGLVADSTIVINVYGNVDHFGFMATSGYEQIVWNFVDATSVRIDGRDLNGSVLAPYATVYQDQVINGTLICNNWVNSGRELHTHLFKGDLGEPSEPSVPGPAAAVSFGSALVAGIIRRRKRA